MRHGLSIAAGVTLLLGTIACADGPEFDPQRVEVNQASGKLPDGRRWRARYYFDRNALAATALTGDTVVALTSTGNLLAIDAAFLNTLAERVPPRAATCLGTGADGEVLAGFADGSIQAIDPFDLVLSPRGRVAGHPVWVGMLDDRLAACAWEWDPDERVVGDPAPNRLRVIYVGGKPAADFEGWDQVARCFFVDSRGRLFHGEDHGEFGGAIAVFDPKTGAVRSWGSQDVPVGIYAFAEDAAGRILAVGGMIHMGSRFAFAAEVGETGPEAVGYWGLPHESGDRRGELDRDGGPDWPLAALVPESCGWLGIAGQTVYRVSEDLGEWESRAVLSLRVHSGYVASVGFRIPLVGIHHRPDGSLLLATARDGLIAVDPLRGLYRTTEGKPQLEIRRPDFLRSAWGIAVIANEWRDARPWVLREGQLRRHPVAPEGEDLGGAHCMRLHPAPDGRLVGAWGGFEECRLAWWVDGEVERLDTRKGSSADRICVTADGIRETEGDDPEVVFGPAGRWCIHDRSEWKGRGPVMGLPVIPRGVDGEPVKAFAVAWLDEETILLATERGLRSCRVGRAETTRFPLSLPPDEKVRHLCRDGAGRIWMAGKTLWLLSLKEGATAYPVLRDWRICTLAADPEDRNGVIVGFENRGLMRLSVGE